MSSGIISWFKSKIFNHYSDELDSRYFHNGYCRRNNGNRNSYSFNLQIPKTGLQLAEAEFFSNQLRQNHEHYRILNANVFEHLLSYHVGISQEIRGPSLISWVSFRINYYFPSIKGHNLYPNAERHLRINIANYDNILTRIESETKSLNLFISNTEIKIKNKVRDSLAEFSLIELDGRLTIFSILEDYWFNKILYAAI